MSLHLKPEACLLALSSVKLDKSLLNNKKLRKARDLVSGRQHASESKQASQWALELDDALDYYQSLIEISKAKGISSKGKLQLEQAKLAVMEAIFSEYVTDFEAQPQPSKAQKALAIGLCVPGTLFALAEGAVGISAVITSFIANPAWFVWVPPAIVFGILNVFIYYGFEMTEISRELGVSLFDVKSVMNVYFIQEALLEKFYSTLVDKSRNLAQIADPVDRAQQRERLGSYAKIASLAKKDMDSKINGFMAQSQPTKKQKAGKLALSAFAGLLFAFDGFFILKECLLLALGAAFIATPVGLALTIGFGVSVGVSMGLLAYWCIERKGVVNLVDRFAGKPVERKEALKEGPEKTDTFKIQLKSNLELDTRRVADAETHRDMREDIHELAGKRERLAVKIKQNDQLISDRFIVPKRDLWTSKVALKRSEARLSTQEHELRQQEQKQSVTTPDLRATKKRIKSVVRHQKVVKQAQSSALALSQHGLLKAPRASNHENYKTPCQITPTSV